LGWQISASHNPWLVWIIIAVGALVVAALLSSPSTKLTNGSGFFKSDTRSFLFLIAGAFLSVIIIWRLHIFAHALVTISSGILFKLDAQKAGLSNRQTFWIMTIVSLAGLGLGAAVQIAIYFTFTF
jgi:hypothetical protein